MYTNRQKRYLRSLAHSLKPVVRVGQRGVTPALGSALDDALLAHELVKVKVEAGGRAARDALIDEICRIGDAHLVQRVGNVAVIYRRNERKPKIELP